ncbi:MAG TPA: hypothetical protein VD926_01340, partial [Acidimicrobiales bacterium]|nr:hypothetical protein [Acidimicrobiales bacterium]
AVSGGIHLRLYREGYRDISLDRVLGIDISRSFALNAVLGAAIGVSLVAAALGRVGWRVPAVAGLVFSAAASGAYALTRTVGLLGFEEDRWVPEAWWAEGVQLAAVAVLGGLLLTAGRARPGVAEGG